MGNLAISVQNVSKEYRLGTIGGGTLRGDLQSYWARIRHKEDPNLAIGSVGKYTNERFLALNDVTFDVEKGQALGIIGHNGAGKSTLLKLLSRVTAPTKGCIYINGKISSMLEVGTGFHPELTGRENVYMNGAILGMTRADIARKFDDIVEFAEMSKFIDTPVKRYSSGMYVKLAFAVAAHLDSEILAIDEVLAVGDMKFQQKCLGKMNDISKSEGRTILYVSHNMGTVRRFCDRCIVMNQGEVQYDGDVEKAIELYYDTSIARSVYHESRYAGSGIGEDKCRILSTRINNSKSCVFLTGEKISFDIDILSNIEIEAMTVQLIIKTGNDVAIGSSFAKSGIKLKKGDNHYKCILDLGHFTPGNYEVDMVISEQSIYGSSIIYDKFENALTFSTSQAPDLCNNNPWYHRRWGYVRFDEFSIDRD